MIVITGMGGRLNGYAAESLNLVIENSVNAYMENRSAFLKDMVTNELEEVSVSGIVEDEQLHKEKLDELGIEYGEVEFQIENISISDNFVKVTVYEKVIYTKNVECIQEETTHLLTLMQDAKGNWGVVSDAYMENFTDFVSCSYVPENTEISTLTIAQGITPTIVQIAESQVGYLEKDSNSSLDSFTANAGDANYTKYGAWYGYNPADWCAMFVSWCADQAGISSGMFPKYAGCYAGLNTFDEMGRYYEKGSYTPKVGDIFFQAREEPGKGHTGIVISVSGNTMTIIDGNCNNGVRRHTMAITDSSILGFVTPCIHTSVQKYNVLYHWNACSMCNTQLSLKVGHTFSATGKCLYCPATQNSTAAKDGILLRE